MRRFVQTALALAMAAGMSFGSQAYAQKFPDRPIRIIVPFAAGGGTDTIARLLAPGMGEALGQTVIVEDRPGAGTIIGTNAVAQAAPDGYTLLVTLDQTMTMNPFLYSKLTYNPERDFAPVAMLVDGPRVYASNPKVPAKTLKEFVEYAKANPDKVNYASGAISGRVGGENLMDKTGAKMVFIPYNGGPPALKALLANEVQLVIADPGTFAPGIRDGRLVGLAVSTAKRSPMLPDVPTLRELGYPELEDIGWWGMFAPAGTPQPIIAALNAAVTKALADKTVQDRILLTGNYVVTGSADQLKARVAHDSATWGAVIKKAGLKLD